MGRTADHPPPTNATANPVANPAKPDRRRPHDLGVRLPSTRRPGVRPPAPPGKHRRNGRPLQSLERAWEEARELAFTPAQVESPLAERPAVLCHAALSMRLNADVSLAECGQCVGNSVELLLKRYVSCLDGQVQQQAHRTGAAGRLRAERSFAGLLLTL
ncbi:hypothetical protein GCM10022214_38360 [Actinomadura miaoliensis]|uniref:Uncharacterized protein n=1 Tax=Actinomadura miaoliensis TaxID=430685 RepID=A0ABP7VYC2_9ACTN